MTPPEIVNATQAQLDDLLAKVKSTLTAQEYLLLEGVLGTFICVMLALQNAKTSESIAFARCCSARARRAKAT